MTVFISILNQIDIHLVQNRKETRHHDHIPFNLKGNGNIVFFSAAENRQQTFYHLFHYSFCFAKQKVLYFSLKT